MDAHIPRAITIGLRVRGVDVITAQEDNAETSSDPELLDRAIALRRVLFTFDDDLLAEAARHQQEDVGFSGIIYAHPLRISIGTRVDDLEVLSKTTQPEDWSNQVVFLPL
jgi:hypothetical protein